MARVDVELGEHLAQVVLDRARADEQLGADLRVRQPVASEPRDLSLLGGECIACLVRAFARSLAGGRQLAAGALRERLHPHLTQHLVSGAELLACLHPAALAAQPFAVDEVRTGELDAHTGVAKAADRFAVEGVGGASVADQRP